MSFKCRAYISEPTHYPSCFCLEFFSLPPSLSLFLSLSLFMYILLCISLIYPLSLFLPLTFSLCPSFSLSLSLSLAHLLSFTLFIPLCLSLFLPFFPSPSKPGTPKVGLSYIFFSSFYVFFFIKSRCWSIFCHFWPCTTSGYNINICRRFLFPAETMKSAKRKRTK